MAKLARDTGPGVPCDAPPEVLRGRLDVPGRAPLEVQFFQPKKYAEALAHVDNNVSRRLRLEDHSPSLPIEILDVIRENDHADRPAMSVLMAYASAQWRARCHGIGGIHGNDGIMKSVSYRF